MCRFAAVDEVRVRQICSETGNMPACQLCPRSPTYWRRTATPSAAERGTDPWGNTPKIPAPELDMTGWVDDRSNPITPNIIDSLRCVLCRVPTTWISPKGTRCHPSCARMYLRQRAHRTTAAASAPDQT